MVGLPNMLNENFSKRISASGVKEHKERYNQLEEIEHLFQSLVLPKVSYGLPVYVASVPELNTVQQQLLRRSHKRRFICYAIDKDLLEKTDRTISKKISCLPSIRCIICMSLP